MLVLAFVGGEGHQIFGILHGPEVEFCTKPGVNRHQASLGR